MDYGVNFMFAHDFPNKRTVSNVSVDEFRLWGNERTRAGRQVVHDNGILSTVFEAIDHMPADITCTSSDKNSHQSLRLDCSPAHGERVPYIGSSGAIAHIEAVTGRPI